METHSAVAWGVSKIMNQPDEYQRGQGCRSDSASANVFLNTVKLIAFRAQDMLMQVLSERDPQLVDAGRVLRSFFDSWVDLVPDLNDRTLVVRLRLLNNNGHEQIYQYLCATLTATETRFPGTDLRLIYECTCSV
jgi:hypothetical protein